MTAFLLVDDGTVRDRWLAARAGEVDGVAKISATDAARIVTGGAKGWASLRKEKQTGRGFGGNASTRHGREREAAIAAWAQQEFGLQPSTALVAHADFPADLATPDALSTPHVDGLGIPELSPMMSGVRYVAREFGEYKTTVKDWPTWADVPKRYFWQVVWQFYVTGADRCRFVFEPHQGFVPLHMEPRVFTIERADVLDDIATAVERVAEWRAAGDEDAEVPEALLPLDGLLSAYDRAKEALDAEQERVDDLAEQIRAVAAEYQAATGKAVQFEGSDANLSLSLPGTSSRFDSKAFAAKYPHQAKHWTRSTPTKSRLTITGRN